MKSRISEIPFPNDVVVWARKQLRDFDPKRREPLTEEVLNLLIGRVVVAFSKAIDNFCDGPMVVRWYRQKACPICKGGAWDKKLGGPCLCSRIQIEPDYETRKRLATLALLDKSGK